ncbi:MAG: universal stress protein [Crocinitomicaceae bacterium]|nr:universal stress protein [Crocinitomicaceae bacterium]
MNILLLTDYSELSANIRSLTDNLAFKCGAKLFVLNIIQTPSELNVLDHENVDMKCASDPQLFVDRRNESLEKMKSFTSGLKSEFETFVYYGGILDTIEEFIVEKKIDMLAMGTNYKKGIKNIFSKSLIEYIIRDVNISVLSLKTKLDDPMLHNLIIGGHFTTKKTYDLKMIKAMQKAFGAELHLVCLDTAGLSEEQVQNDTKAFIQENELEVSTITVGKGSDYEMLMGEFVEAFEAKTKLPVEMLCLERKQRSDVAKFFSKGKAAKFVNRVHKPILTYISKPK